MEVNPFAGIQEAAARKRDNDRSSYIGPQTMAELKQALAERDAGITAAMSPVGAEVFNFGVMMMGEFKK